MNTADVKTIKMFGPALSGPPRLVNRDVPVCDEQAYKAAGYKRGFVPEEVQEVVPEPVQTQTAEIKQESKPVKPRKGVSK